MIIHYALLKFLEIIELKDNLFTPITEGEIRGQFKNNEYYNIIKFCITNNLIQINFHVITLTSKGKNLYNSIKELILF